MTTCFLTNQPIPVFDGSAPEHSIADDDLPAGAVEIIIIRRVPNPDMEKVARAIALEREITKAQLAESGIPAEVDNFTESSVAAKYHALLKDLPAVLEEEERRYIHPNAPGSRSGKLGKMLRSRILVAHAQGNLPAAAAPAPATPQA
ncbi:MAG: hypothetical protein P1V36_15830 [Planctomycetota bacterium]|nr:hypothetical protein [Planctomycetota bacterium]